MRAIGQAVRAAALALLLAAPAFGQDLGALRAAADAGDRDAALDLLDGLINGSDAQPRDLEEASRLLDLYAEVLTPNQVELRRYLIYVGAASAAPDYFRQVAIGFDAQAPSQKRAALRRTLRLDRNAYVFVLERELAARGLHPTPPDARLDDATLRSILGFCASVGILAECQRGPLRRDTARAIADALWPREPD